MILKYKIFILYIKIKKHGKHLFDYSKIEIRKCQVSGAFTNIKMY